MGTSTLPAHHRAALHGELSRDGSSQACWRLIPGQIYHWAHRAQTAHAVVQSCSIQGRATCPSKARQGMGAAARSKSQLPQGHSISDQSLCQGTPLVLSGMLSANYTNCTFLPTESSWQNLGTKYMLQQLETQMAPCPGSTGDWSKRNCRGGAMGIFVTWTSRPEPRDPSAKVSGEGQVEWRERWLSCLGSPVWERRAILPAQPGQILFSCCPCASALSVPSYSITASHRFTCEILISPFCRGPRRTFTGVSLGPQLTESCFDGCGQLFTVECGCEASSARQSLRWTPSPFLSGHPNHYFTI